MYKVHIGYTIKGNDRWKKFPTLKKANEFCNQVFAKTKIILTIVKSEVNPCNP